ncbi:ATP-NAD kinase-like domain-containing protein [Pilobolus umbonatus]|nr:ATP-NAD kinase-like domain-containing protein [Pilobolus umbonatus]
MTLTLHVNKAYHPVTLTIEEEGLRIEGDLTAAKKSRKKTTLCCIPVPSGLSPDPTLLPIDHEYIIDAFYQPRSKTVEIITVMPEDRTSDTSPSDIYRFIYTVEAEKIEETELFCKTLIERAYEGVKYKKRLLVLINPTSGRGKTKEIFEYNVRSVFEYAKCSVDVKYTGHQGHGVQIAQDLDINKYDAVVTVSGDGTIHEVINGFLKRPDANEVLKKIPIGVIPGGTGNAISLSMCGETRGMDAIYTALQVVKGKPLAIDLCSIQYDDHRYFSFLSQNYGVTAYADLGTEHLRWMGDIRCTLGVIQEIMSRHTYRIKASICVEEADKKKIIDHYRSGRTNPLIGLSDTIQDTFPPLSEPVPDSWLKIEGDILFFLASKVPILGPGMISHPCASPNDGLLDLSISYSGVGIAKELDILQKVETGQHIHSEHLEYYKIKGFRLEPVVKPGEKAYVSIDGEHAPCKPFQVEVHPHLGSILSLKPSYAKINL